MSGLPQDIHYEQYQQCASLYDEQNWEECLTVGLRNMAACTMSRYLHIKTLVLMVGAEQYSWYKADAGHHHYCPPEDLS
jgi:hypothetical protein